MVARRLLNRRFDAWKLGMSSHVDVPILSKSNGHWFKSCIRVGFVVKVFVSGMRS